MNGSVSLSIIIVHTSTTHEVTHEAISETIINDKALIIYTCLWWILPKISTSD
ncbi:MAG: hypothetical protein HN561_10075 [Candidatus Scalindua sp.]|nr:hypothetical protein [Candidatus Scalindua sp.]